MYKSDPPQCCYYISIFANIWYLIKLIHSIIIILRVFMFYKQRVLALLRSKRQRELCQSEAQRCMLLRCAYEVSDKQFVYASILSILCTSRTHINVAIVSVSQHLILGSSCAYSCFINSASWQTFEVQKRELCQSQAQRCMLLRCAYETSDQAVYLCRPRCLFDLKSLLRRAVYKTLICARWI